MLRKEKMDNSNLASFKPLVITEETLQILAKQDNYANCLALYMAYVEITTWKKKNSIDASTSFMKKRLKWGDDKFFKAKKTLVELGLIEESTKKTATNQIEKFYILVKHVVTSHYPQNTTLANSESQYPQNPVQGNKGTNINDLQQNINDLHIGDKKIDGDAPPIPPAPPTILKLQYEVIKKYALPVSNNNEVRAKAKQIEQEIGYEAAAEYLSLLIDHDYNAIKGSFKPELQHSRDVYNKRVKIQKFLSDNSINRVKSWTPPTPEEEEAEELARKNRDWGF